MDHIGDVHHYGLVDFEAATFDIDDRPSGGQQVVEPVDIGAIRQRDYDILVGLVGDHRGGVARPGSASLVMDYGGETVSSREPEHHRIQCVLVEQFLEMQSPGVATPPSPLAQRRIHCLLYTSDAADE